MTIKLTRQEQKVIEKLLVKRPKRCKANKTLLKLVGQGFGELCANHTITYSQKDFADLATIIDKQNIADDQTAPNPLNATSNRLEVATYRADEKWSQAKVFAQQILIVGMDCPIPLSKPSSNDTPPNPAQQAVDQYERYDIPATPIGVLPSVLPEFLDISRFNKLIIIENGQLMTHWWQWRGSLPAKWQSSLLIYRGHGDNLSWLLSILPKLPTACEVLLSFDLDLSGLRMTSLYAKLCSGNVSTLLPELIFASQPIIPLYNQSHKITEQIDGAPASSLLDPLQPVYKTLVDHNIALMQEHLLQDVTVEWIEIVL
ncbi:DUF7281 domain-containing protein [Psychrobacter fulvigenes]|uniref:DUF7281 domain-containing protein n=1 Tax=Psychrobacter fulvigenes TaxID=533323 RepID=UPI001919BC4B|nr:hypothetical protein [Psychrobacter fulvigenes]